MIQKKIKIKKKYRKITGFILMSVIASLLIFHSDIMDVVSKLETLRILPLATLKIILENYY